MLLKLNDGESVTVTNNHMISRSFTIFRHSEVINCREFGPLNDAGETVAQQTVTGSQKAETLTQIAEYIQRFAITMGQYLNDEYEVELNDIARQLRLLS